MNLRIYRVFFIFFIIAITLILYNFNNSYQIIFGEETKLIHSRQENQFIVEQGESIQDKIDSSPMGSTIKILAGTYHEFLLINHSIKILGEKESTVTIIGERTGIKINSDNVTIENLNLDSIISTRSTENVVSHTRNSPAPPKPSIGIYGNNNAIINCRINTNLDFGILIHGNSNLINDNEILSLNCIGIEILGSNNTIQSNFINNCSGGIDLSFDDSDVKFRGNTIIDNRIQNCQDHGIDITSSENNRIINNDIENASYHKSRGFFIETENNEIKNNRIRRSGIYIGLNNDVKGNSLNGYEIIYYYKEKRISIDNRSDIGAIILADCQQFIIENLTLKNSTICLIKSRENIIRNNKILNDFGNCLTLKSSSSNFIENNELYSHRIIPLSLDCGNGIYLEQSSKNIIRYNNIHGFNGKGGSQGGNGILNRAKNNKIISNEIWNNSAGIYSYNGWDVVIKNNKIFGNSRYGAFIPAGIYLPFGRNNSIRNNEIIDNYGEGIYLSSTENYIDNNNISGNMKNGIYIHQTIGNYINNNTIADNDNEGIYIVKIERQEEDKIENNILINDDIVYGEEVYFRKKKSNDENNDEENISFNMLILIISAILLFIIIGVYSLFQRSKSKKEYKGKKSKNSKKNVRSKTRPPRKI